MHTKDAFRKLLSVLICAAICLSVFVTVIATGESNTLAADAVSVTLNETTLTLDVGGSAVLCPSINMNGSTAAMVTASWSYYNQEVISFDSESCTVMALKPGSAEVTYTAIFEGFSQSASCIVTVRDPSQSGEPTEPAVSHRAEIADSTEGTAQVYGGGTVAMTVTASGVGDGVKFSRAELVVTYDKDRMTYVDASPADPTVTVTPDPANGKIRITRQGTDISSLALATLNFTAVSGSNTETVQFAIESAKFTDSVSSLTGNMKDAETSGDSVEVVKPFVVNFVNEDGAKPLYGPFHVDCGKTLPAEIVDPAKDHYTFDGWIKNGDTSAVLTTSAILSAPATEDATYKAKFSPRTNIPVTLNENVVRAEGTPETATYLTDYQVKIADAFRDEANYDYTVTYTVGNGEAKTLDVADPDDGVYSIPGDEITDSLTVSVTRTLDNSRFKVETYPDYVTGWLLVTVTYLGSDPAPVYTFDGNAMFVYDGTQKVYAWLTDTALGDTEGARNLAVAEKLGIASSAAQVISVTDYDVNGSGVTDGADVDMAWQCYKKTYSVADYMAKYLAADVNGDHKVDLTDVNAIAASVAGQGQNS